jgi:hypothetical protein
MEASRFHRFLCRHLFESSLMKKHCFPFAMIALVTIGTVMAAGTAKFDGEFVDKKFLNGQGVFEFSVHQSGSALEIAFDAAYSNGPAPRLMRLARVKSTETPLSSLGRTVTQYRDGHDQSRRRRYCRVDENRARGGFRVSRVLS